MTRKLVIIPTYNESEVISGLIDEITRVCPDADILVVDDNSPDGTGVLVDYLGARDKRVNCLHRPAKQGIGPAYVEAFKWAVARKYGSIAQMDADFSHDPAYLPGMFALLDKYDLVIGSRYVKGGGTKNWGIVRKFISRFGSLYAKIILRLPVNDLTGGFKCFRAFVLESIGVDKIFSRGYMFQIETTYRTYKKGFSIVETPIIFRERRGGKTKMTGDIVREAMFSVIKLRKKA